MYERLKKIMLVRIVYMLVFRVIQPLMGLNIFKSLKVFLWFTNDLIKYQHTYSHTDEKNMNSIWLTYFHAIGIKLLILL